MKSSKSIPKFSWKSVKNQPILGLKKPAGLSVLEDRSSGGLGPPKMPSVRAVLGLRLWPDPSLLVLQILMMDTWDILRFINIIHTPNAYLKYHHSATLKKVAAILLKNCIFLLRVLEKANVEYLKA